MKARCLYTRNGVDFLGAGRRRQCYLVRGTNMCIKFYHTSATMRHDTKITTRLQTLLGRRARIANVNYQEWRYYQRLKKQLPPEVLKVFPEHAEAFYCPEHGWGIMESAILNADGTAAHKALDVLKQSDDPALCRAIYDATETLLERFVEYRIRVFDMSNILLQWQADSTFSLRVADFEPECRALVPGLAQSDIYVRCKLRRRSRRYLKRLRSVMKGKGIKAPYLPRLAAKQRSPLQKLARSAGLS